MGPVLGNDCPVDVFRIADTTSGNLFDLDVFTSKEGDIKTVSNEAANKFLRQISHVNAISRLDIRLDRNGDADKVLRENLSPHAAVRDLLADDGLAEEFPEVDH